MAIGGSLCLAQGMEGAGQQYRDRPGTCHRRHARVARVFEMIGRERAEFGGERRAAGIRELVGVQLHRQPVRTRGREHASCLRLREADRLAERIDGIRESHGRGNDFATDEIDIIVSASVELRRHRVRGEQRGPHVDTDFGRDPSRRLKLPAFVRGVETIAGLDLDRGHAFFRQRRESRPAGGDKLVVRRGAGRFDRGLDAPAGPRDFGIRGAVEARFELVHAIAGVDEMGMTVDQPGRGPRPMRVERSMRRHVSRQVALDAHPGDRLAHDPDGAVVNRAIRRLAAHRREMRAGDDEIEHGLTDARRAGLDELGRRAHAGKPERHAR